MKTLPLDYLNEALSYDPESGGMRWKERPRHHFSCDRGWRTFNSRFAGKEAGTLSGTTGYVMVNFSHGNLFSVHRLALAMSSGEWSPFVDHIDGVRSNNRLANLRACSASQNQCNRGKQSNNKSGFKGVYLHAPGRWRAVITIGRKSHRLGLFDTPDMAHQAYRDAASTLHGVFASVE